MGTFGFLTRLKIIDLVHNWQVDPLLFDAVKCSQMYLEFYIRLLNLTTAAFSPCHLN